MPVTDPNPKHPHILLAEDDSDLRALLTAKLEGHGHQVTACKHGLDLVEQLDRAFGAGGREDVDLVITDILMPGVTGMSILEGLNAFARRCPVVLMTAFGDAETHAKAKRLNATALFDKPFDVREFLDRIEEVLEQRKR